MEIMDADSSINPCPWFRDTLLDKADIIVGNFQRDLDRKSVYHSLINTMWHIIRHCWHIIRHWCHGIMGKGWWTNLHPWLPSKQIPHRVKANPQMEQVDDFVTSIYQPAHLLDGILVSRNHGWGLMEQSTRRALALQVVLFCPNLFENCLIICQYCLLMPNNVSGLWWLMCDIWIFWSK